jgi:hypothetical protein
MPLVQFKDNAKHAGKSYRQNQRVDFPEVTAARLVSLNVAEVVRGQKVSSGFEAMVSTFRESRVKKLAKPTEESRAKAAAEMAELRDRPGPRRATQF